MNDRRYHFNQPSYGFTLVELLMVIGIIAILALIALPNFLDAQTRAKVSRAKADLRTIATAVETYVVDHNHYSPPVAYLGSGPYTPEDPSQDEYEAFVPPRMTSPVAYITSLPSDPFPMPGRTEHPPRITFHYSTQENNEQMEDPMPYFIPERLQQLGMQQIWGCRYMLASHGPDLTEPGPWPALYDPTNGTASNGDIYYLGPGIGPR